MSDAKFIIVGENIHCTRIYKVNGKFVQEQPDGTYAVGYKAGAEQRLLPIPSSFKDGADWEAGKVKHCAVAIANGTGGDPVLKEKGIDYLACLAQRQEQSGATYLDINVDEFSSDLDARVSAMTWTVEQVQKTATIPMSIDSSNMDVMKAGLAACDASKGRPMVNSVSLERADAIGIAADAGAVVIASAAGESGLPATREERLANIARLMTTLRDAGFEDGAIHIDPLVFPISVDGRNGVEFLETVKAIRATYGPDVHIVAGLSNVSFGMPKRKLINQVFARLAVDSGADGGIVDPMQINSDILAGLDTESEPFQLARALLLGEDDFGMDYITATRDGRL